MTYKFENANILIVDDMQPMLGLVSSLLKIFGFKSIITATDAEDAFAKFCRYDTDIVLTDWLMEPYNGIELTQKIRTSPMSPNRFVPVVLMTGYSHRLRVEQARDCGVTEFLVKPFSAKDLYARIEQLVEKPRKFVELDDFFGPDRRRRKAKDYKGPLRRDQDEFLEISRMDKDDAENLLKDLKKQAKGTVNKDKTK